MLELVVQAWRWMCGLEGNLRPNFSPPGVNRSCWQGEEKAKAYTSMISINLFVWNNTPISTHIYIKTFIWNLKLTADRGFLLWNFEEIFHRGFWFLKQDTYQGMRSESRFVKKEYATLQWRTWSFVYAQQGAVFLLEHDNSSGYISEECHFYPWRVQNWDSKEHPRGHFTMMKSSLPKGRPRSKTAEPIVWPRPVCLFVVKGYSSSPMGLLMLKQSKLTCYPTHDEMRGFVSISLFYEQPLELSRSPKSKWQD